jgi:hypothetical protein
VGAVTGPLRATRLLTARDAVRTQLLTLGAGAFAAGALIFTARNFTLSRRSFAIAEQGQVTDRYTKAIEQAQRSPVHHRSRPRLASGRSSGTQVVAAARTHQDTGSHAGAAAAHVAARLRGRSRLRRPLPQNRAMPKELRAPHPGMPAAMPRGLRRSRTLVPAATRRRPGRGRSQITGGPTRHRVAGPIVRPHRRAPSSTRRRARARRYRVARGRLDVCPGRRQADRPAPRSPRMEAAPARSAGSRRQAPRRQAHSRHHAADPRGPRTRCHGHDGLVPKCNGPALLARHRTAPTGHRRPPQRPPLGRQMRLEVRLGAFGGTQ